MNKLLALDQSSIITGYAIFEDDKLIHYGKFKAEDSDIGQRLVYIKKQIQKLIEDNNIDEVVFEDIQFQNNVVNNVQTFKILAEVFGVIYEFLSEKNIKNSSVLASSWKSTLGIKGKNRPEQKRNAQDFILNTFKIKPTQDECDAICIGYHHILNKSKNFDWSD